MSGGATGGRPTRAKRPAGGTGHPPRPPAVPGVAARRVAAEALARIAGGGAYANLVVPAMLERSELEPRDRAFVTDLVYGTTRMQRACDWLVDRYLPDPDRVDTGARAWLRLGAFQLAMLGTPPHAAVGTTVEAAPKRIKGLLNAVLRKVASSLPVTWPDDSIRLSQPDWIVARLTRDLGAHDALDALAAMNLPAEVTVRADGYVQDLASQWVADAVGAGAGDRIADLCSAPGGKATALAQAGAHVVAVDLRPSRAGLVAANAQRLGLTSTLEVVVADATRPPFPEGSFDKVLLDAPCSGLGALRRRPDARWRIEESDVEALAALQAQLVDAALALLRPGGELTYSVCTLTRAESEGIDAHLAAAHDELVALEPPGAPWRPLGRGAVLLPQDAGTDGMYILRLRRPR